MPVSATPPVRVAPPPPGWNSRPVAAAVSVDKKATQSLLFGIASFVLNPLLLSTIIAITYGVKALRGGTVHRGRAIAGIVLGACGLMLLITAAVVVPPLVQTAVHAAAQHDLESKISASMAQQGLALTEVDCPAVVSTVQGTTVTCTGRQPGSAEAAVQLEVRFVDAAGDFTVRASRAV